jgi:hypothetical protein
VPFSPSRPSSRIRALRADLHGRNPQNINIHRQKHARTHPHGAQYNPHQRDARKYLRVIESRHRVLGKNYPRASLTRRAPSPSYTSVYLHIHVLSETRNNSVADSPLQKHKSPKALRKQVFTRRHHARLRLVRCQIHHTITGRQYSAKTTLLSGRGHPPGRAAVGIGAVWRRNDASWVRRERHDDCACTPAVRICRQVAGIQACKTRWDDRVLGSRRRGRMAQTLPREVCAIWMRRSEAGCVQSVASGLCKGSCGNVSIT